MSNRVFLSVSVLLAALSLAAAEGNFRGEVVGSPERNSGKSWLYIQSQKGSIRRVEISAAHISYAPQVNKRDRAANPSDALREGTQVQVSATQDELGEWRATTITILSVRNPVHKTSNYAAARS